MLWYFREWSIVVSSAAVFVCSRNAPTQDASFQLAGEARYETKITAMESQLPMLTNFHRDCKRSIVIPP